MDFVKKAAEGIKGNSGENKDQAAQGQDGEQQDYVDKAFGMAASKSGHNIDRNTQEKITDAGRTAYEKATGSKVNPKISN
ncbi:hypothetical protein H634G_01638 [Metarhizium anisopliae BRIP 53293]|uniref:Uncharacterized protein n=1 Tax=Metarhizium anisopliae BRIP 53293 TaxID=1291518 RepID=A0A0D9PB83_METAN|nr:hypothetical protein H634G_01638 [Metarhizium anisopliae BRIP 53293]KJK92371.1 hypothetical protein H633G_03728 [Metarhizium anisopliae BRIP 53284]